MIKMYNVDCMEWMKDKPDKCYDWSIVDPPYFKGVGKLGYFREKNSSINVKRGDYSIPEWDNQIPDDKYLKELVRVSENQIIFGINYYNFIHSAGRIIWDKCNDSSSFSDCEIASCSAISSVKIFRCLWNGMIQAKSIIEPTLQQGDKSKNEKRIHPTQKPVILYKMILDYFCKEGQTILDTHGGSGSICIACQDLDFDLDWMELDKEYYDSACKRFKNHTDQLRMTI
jgi:site-specific DNA-methyltransferase (adenine-specific)